MTQEAIRKQIAAIEEVTAEITASPEKALAFLVAAGIIGPTSAKSKPIKMKRATIPTTKSTTQKKK